MTMPDSPAVPLTIEGTSVLHQLFRIRRDAWGKVSSEDRTHIIREAAAELSAIEGGGPAWSGLYEVLGHKADLMLIHFRPSFDSLAETERRVAKLRLAELLEPVYSYLSVVELGLYESTIKTYGSLTTRGLQPHSEEWNAEIEETLKRQREAMKARLYPERPPQKYICFYPMDRKRGEDKNWYQVPMEERSRMMQDHGAIGRRYGGEVKQIITGSIGFDDWEWGVDLFAEDPLVFKRLIYEMRFDEVSAVYALFGTFYVGIRRGADELAMLLGR